MNNNFLKEFINYTNEIFPAIDMSVKKSLKDALEQFDINKFSWFTTEKLDGITQGDILDVIPFQIQDKNGNYKAFPTKALVLSNSCDLTRDKYITLVPLIPYNDTNEFNDNQKKDLLNNKYNGKMCFTGTNIEGYYVDFTRVQSFNRELILGLIEKGKINLEHSLSQFAWYFLLTKLTIHYMRVEDHELFSSRLCGV